MALKERKPLLRSPAILVVVFAVLLAMTGLVYTHWSTTARVEGQSATGGISISYWDHFTNDDGTVNTAIDENGTQIAWDPLDNDSAAAFDMNVGYSSADPAGIIRVLEDFEDGTTDKWVVGDSNGSIDASNSPETPNVGSYVGQQTYGGACGGAALLFDPEPSPSYIGLYFRAEGGSALNIGSLTQLSISSSGQMYYLVGQGPGETLHPIQPASLQAWYFIELRNIDWLGNTFDIWVDGVERIAGAAFRLDVDSLSRIQFYRCQIGGSPSLAYVDDITFGFERYDKDVGHCHVGVEGDEDGEFLSIWVGNAYPSYYCTALAYVVNHGSVPIKAEIGSVVGAQQVDHVCDGAWYDTRTWDGSQWVYSGEVLATYFYSSSTYSGDDDSPFVDADGGGEPFNHDDEDVRILYPNDNGKEYLDFDNNGTWGPEDDVEVYAGCSDVVTELELEPNGPWVDALDPETGEPLVNLGFDQVSCGYQLDPAFDVFDPETGDYLYTEEPAHFPMQVHLHVKQPADPDTTYRFQVAQTFRNWNEFDPDESCSGAAPPPGNGDIVFVDCRGLCDFFALDPGGVESRLANTGHGEQHPDFSPDGTQLAYTYGPAQGVVDILTIDYPIPGACWPDLEPCSTHVTSNGGGKDPAWSPGGGLIAYTQHVGSFDDEVFVIPAGGGTPVNVSNNPPGGNVNGYDREATWAPDGSRIAFSSNRTGDYEIWTVAPDGSDPQRLTTMPRAASFPAWSPDGSQVAFLSEHTDHSGIVLWVINADGTNPYVLADAAAVRGAPEWAPDGASILFYRYGSGIWSIDRDGTNLHYVADGYDPAWQPVFGAP